VAGTFCIDPTTAPLADIRASVGSIMWRYQREQQQHVVSGVLEQAATGRPTALGPKECLWAGSVAAINTLLVHDDVTVPGVVCDESGWLATSGDVCPPCGNAARVTPGVIDELVVAVIEAGGSVWHIEADTKFGEYLVAAELRFPSPPTPGDGSAKGVSRP